MNTLPRRSRSKLQPQSMIYKSLRVDGEVVVERVHSRTLGFILLGILGVVTVSLVTHLSSFPQETARIAIGFVVVFSAFFALQVLTSAFRLRRVVLSRSELSYEEETPLRMKRGKPFKIEDVVNVYIDAGPPGLFKKTEPVIALKVLLRSGKSHLLCTTQSLDDAYYIEAVLERHMNIVDRPALDRTAGIQE